MTVNILMTEPTPHLTSDPVDVAKHIVAFGDWGETGDEPKVIILDADEEPYYWLDPDQAIALAQQLTAVAEDVKAGRRVIRRAAAVNAHLRALDG
ncbi:MAG: hypothetical protein PGN24_03730 [Microbacterium arborescens]